MFHLYKIEKRVNQGNVIPQLFWGETSIAQNRKTNKPKKKVKKQNKPAA